MKIREATAGDLDFIAAANAALATETEGQKLDMALLRPGIQAVLDDRTLGRTTWPKSAAGSWASSWGSNYGVMQTVYRGPESHEE